MKKSLSERMKDFEISLLNMPIEPAPLDRARARWGKADVISGKEGANR